MTIILLVTILVSLIYIIVAEPKINADSLIRVFFIASIICGASVGVGNPENLTAIRLFSGASSFILPLCYLGYIKCTRSLAVLWLVVFYTCVFPFIQY